MTDKEVIEAAVSVLLSEGLCENEDGARKIALQIVEGVRYTQAFEEDNHLAPSH